MGIAVTRGRNTHPVNFQKEIKIRFNLPPLHILTSKFIPDIVEDKIQQTEFFRKGDNVAQANRNFKFKTTSAAIGNFRDRKSELSHVPLNFF